MNDQFSDSTLVDTTEAAKALDISPGLLKAARAGRLPPDHHLNSLPYVRIGRLVKYRRSDIITVIEGFLVKPI